MNLALPANDIATLHKHFNQSDSYLAIMGPNVKFAYIDEKAARLYGYSSANKVIDDAIPLSEMPCRASEFAHEISQENNMVLQNAKGFKLIGHYCYANDDWRVIMGSKQPYRNIDNEVVGVIGNFMDVTQQQYLLNYAAIIHEDAKFFCGKEKKQFTYIIDHTYAQQNLTRRQGECLYYILRGHSNKSIANILGLSPRTVECFADQIKQKFDCNTKAQLIEKSIALGMLRFIPDSAFQRV